MKEPYITNGIFFDPFSLHCAGLTRKLTRTINRDFIGPEKYTGTPFHNEAKFKQAFVNACHFADTMTVVGPICNLVWDVGSPDYVTQALRWPIDTSTPENAWFKDMYQAFTPANNNVFAEATVDPSQPDTYYLNILADSVSNAMFPPVETQNDASWLDAFDTLYYRGNNLSHFPRVIGSKPAHNAPMLGLMAVIFTYKKRDNAMGLGMEELTNLSQFPPTVFFLPVLVPSNPGVASPNRAGVFKTLFDQPLVSTYQIHIDPMNGGGGSWDQHKLMTFGSPFRFQNIDIYGKSSDCLRSLSDVFSSLWSQATLYSAWNMGISPDNSMGCLYLEPMGAGRRIRGYNRFKSYYKLFHYDAVYHEYGDANVETKEVLLRNPVWARDYVKNQARPRGLSGPRQKNYLFVLPSFLGNTYTHQNIKALCIHLMANFQSSEKDTISGRFITGSLFSTFCAALSDAMIIRPDNQNPCARPLERVEAAVSYSTEGDPSVFQMSIASSNHDINDKFDSYSATTKENPVSFPSPQALVDLYAGVDMIQSHGFTEVFCSGNPTELTKTFKEVPKATKRKKEALVEETDIIDLFGDSKALF